MIRTRACSAALLAGWLATSGCMTMREIPREEFATRAAHRPVRVETREGLLYEFDYADFAGDTLVGYRSRTDTEGAIDQVTELHIPYEELQRVSVRQLDWRRTSMIGGGTLAAALVMGLKLSQKQDNTQSTSPGGKPFYP